MRFIPATEHDQNLAVAFDGQAAAFENAPVQSDPVALAHFVSLLGLPRESEILDAGCGPGLVAEALLVAGYRVVGIDLSREMIERATLRCARFGDRCRFTQRSVFDSAIDHRFDGVVSRYVIHHLAHPRGFVARLEGLLRPGGVMLVCDHTTDPAHERAEWHQRVERARDRTHTRNLTPGELVDLIASAGLQSIAFAEEPFTLDFDEWFDRGTPALSKHETLALIRSGPGARGFTISGRESCTIHCVRGLVRGIKPVENQPQ